MRILMVSDVYFPRVNGVSTSIQTYRTDLLAAGHQCLLVAPEYPVSMADDEALFRLPSRRVPRDPEDRLLSLKRLRQWSLALQPGEIDIVHVQTPFTAHYAGVSIAKRLGVPVVESYHTYFEHYLHHYLPALPAALTRRFARRVTLSQCRQVSRLLSPSRQMADALRAYGVQTPIDVMPTGLPPSAFALGEGARFRQLHDIPATRPLALFVGRVAHEKNIDFLLKVVARVKLHQPDILFVIAGEGPARPGLEAEVKKCITSFNSVSIPIEPVWAYTYGAYPKKNNAQFSALSNVFKNAGILYAMRIGNRINKLKLKHLYSIQRIDIRGNESFTKFRWKVKFGKLF